MFILATTWQVKVKATWKRIPKIGTHKSRLHSRLNSYLRLLDMTTSSATRIQTFRTCELHLTVCWHRCCSCCVLFQKQCDKFTSGCHANSHVTLHRQQPTSVVVSCWNIVSDWTAHCVSSSNTGLIGRLNDSCHSSLCKYNRLRFLILQLERGESR